MKKLILIAIALIGLQVTAQGHRKGGDDKNMSAKDMATNRTEKMVEHLGLDKTQEKAVYALNLKEAENRKAKMEARKEGEKPSEDEREKMKEERAKHKETYKAELKEILTDEQYAKLESKEGKKGKGNKKKEKKS